MRNDEGLLLVKENGVWAPTGSYCRWKIAKTCEISIPLSSIKLARRKQAVRLGHAGAR